ncbi:MAG: hypothetical protein R3F21_04200 [Myxococcota bacterium]
MSSSASSTDRRRASVSSRPRHSRAERVVARLLIAALVGSHPLAASAGDELSDADSAVFDPSRVSLDNSRAGETLFTIDARKATIGWENLRQPANNRLEFNFTNGGGRGSSVLNYTRSTNAFRLSGQVDSNGTVIFANPYGVYVDGSAVIDVGSFVAIGANVSQEAFLAGAAFDLPLEGRIENHGLILADQNVSLLAKSVLNAGDIAARNGNVLLVGGERIELGDFDALSSGWSGRKDLFAELAGGDVTNTGRIDSADAVMLGGRVMNLGEIEIEDGSLLMVGADAVYLSRFDDPVLIQLPRGGVGAAGEPARYAIENHGRIDAGRGHVRLAAADPLGFGIRQGTGSASSARIAAAKIELEGGENGRVQLSGTLDASGDGKRETGGEIEVTGDLIVLADAEVDASGTRGGGTIRIGGERQGSGDLQRASGVVVDAASAIRADAKRKGDGGEVVVFSEDLTSIEGAISARGGARGGDGGFVETSGLRHFEIADLPDVGARRGQAGSWLIDPYDITITNAPVDCNDATVACLDVAIDAILDPEFDSAGFDGILRTIDSDPNDGIAPTNYVSADLIARALGVGTNVTLSTQSFDDAEGNAPGNITIEDAIVVDSAAILEGQIARLTLLAAGHIFVNANIEVLPIGAGTNERSNLALGVSLRANDASQIETGSDFDLDRLDGDVHLNADIRTGGGSFLANGLSVLQQAGRQIVTRGGDVTIRSGTLDRDGLPFADERAKDDPALVDGAIDTRLELLGDIDTRTADGREDGGEVVLVASSANVGVRQSGDDPLSIVTGLLRLVGDVFTGGGDITLAGGIPTTASDQRFAGSVDVQGTLDSRRSDVLGNLDARGGGGGVTIRANRVDADGDNGDFIVTHVLAATYPTRGDGGEIAFDGTIRTGGGIVAIGNDSARSLLLDGTIDTTQSNTRENGFVQLVARDSAAVDEGDDLFGTGEIRIGENGATSIATSGLVVRTRDLTTSDGTGANAVDIALSGRSSSRFFSVVSDFEAQTQDAPEIDEPQIGVLDIEALRSAVLNENTALSAESIRLVVAPDPLATSEAERANGDVRLVFGGANGGGASASDGVRLNADTIAIAIGDGTTATNDLYSDDLGSLASPTELAVQRQTRGDFRGLQLRDQAGALRPESFALRQDGDLTITEGAATTAGELDLAGAFGAALIGDDGLRLTLESSDGVLAVEDAAGFNNNAGIGPGDTGDAGKSFVRLLGGLLLPDAPPGVTSPDPELVTTPNSVVFGADLDADGIGDQALGGGGTTAFDVEELEVSTPGDFSLVQQIADSIASVADLIFEAGRDTGLDDAAGRGTLTIAAATALSASQRLSLTAGDSGFGDLVFAGAGTSLAADEIELRAGSEGDSRNGDAGDRSRIVGLAAQDVALRDAAGGIFGEAGSSAEAFRYRQAAGIDAAVDLPALSQFGFGVGESFRAEGDVEYAVRSDEGQIDLDDGLVGTNEADRFQNAALSLIGLQSGSLDAIQVSADTAFVGKRVELGGIGSFVFDADLARVFNRSGGDADESLTLRAGVGGSGNLSFSGSGGPVLVKAPTVRLVVGDGTGGESGSTIDADDASFDLAGPLGTERILAYQIDGNFRVSDLPNADQFVGGATGLPSILAIRNDAGQIEIEDFDAAELPLALASGPARLVLEADQITLSQTRGADLELTTNPNLFLRLRANVLSLFAFVSDDDDTESGRVRMGPRGGDSQITAGADADFDGESLLVEAFDAVAEGVEDGDANDGFVTTGNLSAASQDPDDESLFDLAAGRGPTAISVRQDGSVLSADLAHRNSFSGLLARTRVDDDEELPIASFYSIVSDLASVTVTPENVNGSNLFLSGNVDVAGDGAIDFAPGAGADPGHFVLDSLTAQTEDSIVVRAGTFLEASDSIALVAGLIGLPNEEVTEALGSLRFEGTHADGQTTRLEANRITLAAGPDRTLTSPDGSTGGDRDGERDEIDPSFLPKLVLDGLDELALAGDLRTSALRLRQNASFDATLGGEGDFLTALAAGADQAGAGGEEWREIEIASLQGELHLGEIGLLADESSGLIARTGNDGTIVVEMPDQADRAAPFDDFLDGVRLQSNDITFRSDDPNTSIDLATDKLLLVALPRLLSATGEELFADPGRLRSDLEDDPDEEDPLLRPIVRIHQAAAFTSSELPRPDQYAILDAAGATIVRRELGGLDIELRTTGAGTTLTLDDAVRARTTGSNLILRSAGDVAISLADPTPGYADLPAYAALQLASLDIEADGGDGTIAIEPFTIGAAPADLTLETAGDQRFGGTLELQNGLVTTGRDITFEGDVTQSGAPDAGLVVGTRGKVRFEGGVGSLADRLDRLWVLFDDDAPGDNFDPRTPTVEFGQRTDDDGDGLAETPVDEDQVVYTRGDILFLASTLPTRTLVARLEASLASVVDLASLDLMLRDDDLAIGRDRVPTSASVGKALGDLLFDSQDGLFVASGGEKLAVGGTLSVLAANGIAAFSDVAAVDFAVTANEIGLLRRDSGINLDRQGQTHRDGGPSISANTIDFQGVTPQVIGRGRTPRFGLPNPFSAADALDFLDSLAVFGIRPGGRALTPADFMFTAGGDALAQAVPFLVPTGPSRSDLSGAYGPVRVPTSQLESADPARLEDPERLRALAVETRPTPESVVLARLTGAAIIDDRGLPSDGASVIVTESRLDARDAEAAIALYDKLFGAEGQRAGKVRSVLQDALDQYLETHRAQRVVGFELRRFVKNRPSTLIEAYTTLEDLDALFRYHRHLGLSPGEFKRIQRGWLERIQPDGISLEELAETVHPSRYVRGSDILDIFGQ